MLRLGRYQDVLADVECDALVCDPPFGERTHGGDATTLGFDDYRTPITYSHWTAADVDAFVTSWSPRVRGWMVALTSHDLIPAYEVAFERAGRFSFAPVACVTLGMGVRLLGDGPASWTVYAMVARRRTKAAADWRALPGAYVSTRGTGGGGGRGKPLDLMRALVKDYSRPGDLVCDPCAGYGTTGLAALSMGRRFVGAEVDAAAHAEGVRRLSSAQTVDLFDQGRAKQTALEIR